MSVTIHRNLNRGHPWVLTCKAEGRRRVPEVLAVIHRAKISMATLHRIRTPKGDRTPSGAQGLGKRTVGAWLVGDLVTATTATPTGATIHFNPFHDDWFRLRRDGRADARFDPDPSGVVIHFRRDGSVEVLG